jgi:ubiquinone/menaquinone biosynthesis C-methylase UbiE
MSEWVAFFKKGHRSIYSECIKNRRLVQMIAANSESGARMLEAGCGTALLSLLLADLGYQMTALDRSTEVLNYAKNRMVLAHTTRLCLVEGDLFHLRDYFKKEEFAVVCHSGVMEHFKDEEIVAALSEQKHVAKKLIFKVPNVRARKDPSWFGDERLLTNRHWVRLIRKAGYSCATAYGDSDLPRHLYFLLPGVSFRYHPALSFWWRWFSRHTVFVCE